MFHGHSSSHLYHGAFPPQRGSPNVAVGGAHQPGHSHFSRFFVLAGGGLSAAGPDAGRRRPGLNSGSGGASSGQYAHAASPSAGPAPHGSKGTTSEWKNGPTSGMRRSVALSTATHATPLATPMSRRRPRSTAMRRKMARASSSYPSKSSDAAACDDSSASRSACSGALLRNAEAPLCQQHRARAFADPPDGAPRDEAAPRGRQHRSNQVVHAHQRLEQPLPRQALRRLVTFVVERHCRAPARPRRSGARRTAGARSARTTPGVRTHNKILETLVLVQEALHAALHGALQQVRCAPGGGVSRRALSALVCAAAFTRMVRPRQACVGVHGTHMRRPPWLRRVLGSLAPARRQATRAGARKARQLALQLAAGLRAAFARPRGCLRPQPLRRSLHDR